MKKLLELDAISFAYSGAAPSLLDNVSMTLFEGERIGLLGDNGSGKSTLLHIAAGLITPTSGKVLYNGSVCETEKNFVQARRSLGYLLQNAEDQLFSPSILEDVAFGLVNSGMNDKDAEAAAAEALELVGLEHLAYRSGANLSGGEKKLAALATVLVMKPRFLFLDEPTNDLDSHARERLLGILLDCALPLIVISHNHSFLNRICTTRRLLRNGHIEKVEKEAGE